MFYAVLLFAVRVVLPPSGVRRLRKVSFWVPEEGRSKSRLSILEIGQVSPSVHSL